MEFEMSTGTAGGAIAAKLQPADKPMASNDAGRRCAHPQCSTTLSRYNPDDTCSAHGGWSDRSVKRPGRKPKSKQRQPRSQEEPVAEAAEADDVGVTAELVVAPEAPGQGDEVLAEVRELLRRSDAAVRTDGARTLATGDLATITSLVEQVRRRGSEGTGGISTSVRIVDDGSGGGEAAPEPRGGGGAPPG